MTTNHPQLYKVAKTQLEALGKLAEMSIAIDDKEGLGIIQSAEIAIERRIQVTRMNLPALEYLENLISQGHEYPDAEWRTCQCYPIEFGELRKAYDSRVQLTTLSPRHKTLLDDIINIADGMDVLDRGSREFEYAHQNLDRTIDKLDAWGAVDVPIPRLGHLFDSFDHRSCRDEAAQLLGDCQ